MVSSTSLRSPQKTCGLFDTGFAGGDFDVTSLNSGDVSDLFSASTTYSIDDFNEPSTCKLNVNKNISEIPMDNLDFLNPLADLETDPLDNDSLDAFVDLESFLTGDNFLDEDIGAEVAPVINISPADMPFKLGEIFYAGSFTESTKEKVPKLTSEPTNKLLKRKHTKTNSLTKTSLFEICSTLEEDHLEPQLDHDYTAKKIKLSHELAIGQAAETKPDETVVVKESCVTDKQAVRRMKNNVASKRSREQRKQKFADMDQEAEQLIVANENLRKKIVELEKLAQEMKAQLVAKMSGK